MMLAWSTCEPPNGYGVTNCSSLSGNALAALVSAKAAAAVVASEVIDRRVVMISLFATTFLRSQQRPETRLPRTTADFRTWPRRCAPRFPAAPEIQAPIHRAEI